MENEQELANVNDTEIITDDISGETLQQESTPDKTKPKMSKKKKIIIAASTVIILIITAVCATLYSMTIQKEKAEKQYKDSFNAYVDSLVDAEASMLYGESVSAKLCDMVSNVWNDAIYKNYRDSTYAYTHPDDKYVDFNTALYNLYADTSTSEKVKDITTNKDRVDIIMRQLQNPTEEFKACYNTITELYVEYSSITGMSIKLSGSFTSYNNDINTTRSAFMDAYNKLNAQIPDKK